MSSNRNDQWDLDYPLERSAMWIYYNHCLGVAPAPALVKCSDIDRALGLVKPFVAG